MTDKIAALARTHLFGDLASAELESLARQSRVVQLEPGELLFSAGEPCQALFVVVSGRVRALRYSPDGREQIIHEDGPGGTFSEVAIFDGGPYPSSVAAVEASLLLSIPKDLAREFCLTHRQAALRALEVMSQRLRKATGLVEDLALREVGQRVAEYLLEQAEAQIAAGTPIPQVRLRHTNQEIADLIGSVREVVSRAFAKLRKEGLIRKEGRKVKLLDVSALENYVRGC